MKLAYAIVASILFITQIQSKPISDSHIEAVEEGRTQYLLEGNDNYVDLQSLLLRRDAENYSDANTPSTDPDETMQSEHHAAATNNTPADERKEESQVYDLASGWTDNDFSEPQNDKESPDSNPQDQRLEEGANIEDGSSLQNIIEVEEFFSFLDGPN